MKRPAFSSTAYPQYFASSTALGGRLTVTPPVARASHRASVVVLNPDGQSSLFLQGDTPSTYTYFGDRASPRGVSGSLSTLPSSFPAGAEAMLQIDTTSSIFVDGQTVVGFGNSDIVVRQIFVVSPTRLLVNISVSPNAQTGVTNLTIISGLQVLTQPFAFQITPSSRSSLWLSLQITNAVTGVQGVSAGSQAVVSVGNSPVALGGGNTTLYLNDRSIPITTVNGNQITFQVPQGTQTGGAIVRVEVGGERSLPILMIVDPPPPRILSVASEGEPPSTFKPGQLVTVTVKDLQPAGSAIDTSRIEVAVGGVTVSVAQSSPAAGLAQNHGVCARRRAGGR